MKGSSRELPPDCDATEGLATGGEVHVPGAAPKQQFLP